jgi:hypothetical protein
MLFWWPNAAGTEDETHLPVGYSQLFFGQRYHLENLDGGTSYHQKQEIADGPIV